MVKILLISALGVARPYVNMRTPNLLAKVKTQTSDLY